MGSSFPILKRTTEAGPASSKGSREARECCRDKQPQIWVFTTTDMDISDSPSSQWGGWGPSSVLSEVHYYNYLPCCYSVKLKKKPLVIIIHVTLTSTLGLSELQFLHYEDRDGIVGLRQGDCFLMDQWASPHCWYLWQKEKRALGGLAIKGSPWRAYTLLLLTTDWSEPATWPAQPQGFRRCQ